MVLNTAFFIPPDDVSLRPLRDPAFRKFFILSLSVHVVLLALAGTAVLFHVPVKSYTPAYTVDLVTLPPSSVGKRVKVKAPVPVVRTDRPAVKREIAHPPARSVQAAEKEPPTVIRPPEPAPGDETARMERQKKLKNLEEEAARLYESFRAEGMTKTSAPSSVENRDRPAESTVGRISTGPPIAGTGGGSADIRFKAYYDRVVAKIHAAWVLPRGVAAKENNLLTVVGIRISATGVIESRWVEKESGNIYYDQSALRAIGRASPLPPLPEGLGKESLKVGINFRVPK